MFEKIKDRYAKGWIRIDQLRKYVELGAITSEEYVLVCGEEYVA